MTQESDKPEIDPRQVEAFEPLPGELLMGARRSRGMSTAKAAAALNLDESAVLALEENRFGELGAPVFARGHLRKYARLVGLDPDDVMRAYDAVATEQSAAALDVPPAVTESVSGDSGGWLMRILVIAAVIAVGVAVWRLMQNNDGRTTAAGPTGEPAGQVAVVTPRAEQQPPQMPQEQPPQPEETAIAPVEPEASADIPVTPPAGTGADAAGEAGAGTAGAGARESVTPPAPAGPPGALVFEFTQDSWLEVRDADGRRLAYEMGRRGTRRTITGKGPFRVSLGFWPGVSLSYDGRVVPIPESARQGNTARFSVPGAAE